MFMAESWSQAVVKLAFSAAPDSYDRDQGHEPLIRQSPRNFLQVLSGKLDIETKRRDA